MLEGQYIHQYVLPSLSVSGGTISLFSVILNCFSGELSSTGIFSGYKTAIFVFNQPTSRERKDKSVENYNEAEGLPVEVLPTEDVAVPEEALLIQLVPALREGSI